MINSPMIIEWSGSQLNAPGVNAPSPAPFVVARTQVVTRESGYINFRQIATRERAFAEFGSAGAIAMDDLLVDLIAKRQLTTAVC
jgi:hypothetical protein